MIGLDSCGLSGFHIMGKWGDPTERDDKLMQQERACIVCNLAEYRIVRINKAGVVIEK